ncbi:alkaline phosphatase synthesis transcriptional regulatory protein PhoP [Paenibacillus larvae subsp. larvae]|uniref:Alkaline phosphatase synthesis transcriptional regulatory protein PhoP n=1 Tax=Paenibacillus larvae subsp. larvae TaxID=147375 RepID=A0A2L1TX48_9BACL|nr:response regulator transcription factor [Paenibacillus larvae]AQZ45930.1 DNA-binding response regulator [Paenibacillus larvae subsp. pulvifaciens]AVF25257.1 alkaline phosphatase synthesis transcriptional regulatory protein PhoP [Paenibacillus larvae subsp. larvae]AVF30034.1 alkaline phosphatase synthesis transcriptional regulatory protein PhoP [Paenibacillus larvae subsp. larvae]MBH0344555.1 chemotaxis protein CheY [Paenibacillus larvae]MCY7518737.1 response regulator transcription factor [
MSQKILVIEDEPTLSRLLSYNLAQEGYETDVVGDGAEGYQAAVRNTYDLIILDIMLPGMNGFEVLSKLRQKGSKTPVIILTARNAEEEVVQGLKFGADDYITKPFGVAELLARVSAVLRRTGNKEVEDTGTHSGDKVITVGDLFIYPEKYEVVLNNQSIPLRPKEFEVLLYLVKRPGIVVTRDDLMNVVWGFDYIGGQRTVDVHVSSLRKKLEMNQQSVQIESIRGVGYKLVVYQPK